MPHDEKSASRDGYRDPNPLSPDGMKRLRQAMDMSRKKMSTFRNERLESIKQYVGKHYSDNGATDRVPLNLLFMAMTVYQRKLVGRTPKVNVATPKEDLKATASDFEIALDHLIKEIQLDRTLEMTVLDSLFSMGIVKTGLGLHGSVEVDGFTHDVGQPYADWIDIDDWVHDMNAKRYDQVSFAGHKYRLPLEYVKDSGIYQNTKNLKASHRENYQELGDDKTENISRGSYSENDDEYLQYIDLWDIWLPQENLYVTLPVDAQQEEKSKPIDVREWTGPERGPFHLLSFNDVPGQILPLPPAANWIDIHILANNLYRKLGRQAERQKEITAYSGSATADGDRIVDANDGQAIRVEDASQIQQISFGGINQQNMAFAMHMTDRFSWQAGNLDMLAGLGPQSETLGQDEILRESASMVVQSMQDRTVRFTKEVIGDLAWYLHQDPLIEMPLVKHIQSVGIDLPFTFVPSDMEGDFLDYNFEIEPYSMEYRSPSSRLNSLQGIFQNFILPLEGQLQQQGAEINFENLLRLVAKYSNLPEINDIIEFNAATPAQFQPYENVVDTPPSRPNVTERRNVRINKSTSTRMGRDAAMAQTLLGGNVQDAEMSKLPGGS